MRYVLAVLLALGLVGTTRLFLPTLSVFSAPRERCQLDKVGTFSELSDGATQRIEVGGSGGQHLDFYSQPGVKSVSYLVMPGNGFVAHGFGSLWEAADLVNCQGFDYIADASAYARGRLQHGHSGLVVDMWLMTGEARVMANVGCLSWDQVTSLLQMHFVAMELPVQLVIEDFTGGSCGASQLSGSSSSCEPALREDHDPVNGSWWHPQGTGQGYVIVNFWTNTSGHSQESRAVLLAPTDNVDLLGGGASFFRPGVCQTNAQNEFNGNPLPHTTVQQLISEGLARHR